MSVDPPGSTTIHDPPDPLQVRMPGGAVLRSGPQGCSMVQCSKSNANSVVAALQPALAAIQPVLTLIDTVIALKDTVTAIPGLIVGDASTFANALERVANGVSTLATMTPALSVPIILNDSIAVVTAALQAVRDMVATIVSSDQDAQAIKDQGNASGDQNLVAVGEDIERQNLVLLAHAQASMGNLSSLMNLLGNLAGLVPGLPEMPSVSTSGDESAEELLVVIDGLITVLEALQIPGV